MASTLPKFFSAAGMGAAWLCFHISKRLARFLVFGTTSALTCNAEFLVQVPGAVVLAFARTFASSATTSCAVLFSGPKAGPLLALLELWAELTLASGTPSGSGGCIATAVQADALSGTVVMLPLQGASEAATGVALADASSCSCIDSATLEPSAVCAAACSAFLC